MSKSELKHLRLEEIHEPDESLRGVDRTTEAYVGLVDSVKLQGIMNPISVRELKDEEDNIIFGLVDGLQRLSAARDAGLETIPCHIISLDEGNLIEAQIMANVHKIETRPVEYSKALLKILADNVLLTRSELAARLAKTTSWISERLGLLKLSDDIGKLVDDDKIGLSNAYALAKLPVEEQVNFVDRAITMTPQQFGPVVHARVKEIRDAARKGRAAEPEKFQPVPMLRSRKELVAEMELPKIGPLLCKEGKPPTVEAAFALAVLWTLNMDPQSVEIQKARDEERREEKKKQKEKSELEKRKKKAKDAAEKALKLKQEAEELEKEETGKKVAAAEEAEK